MRIYRSTKTVWFLSVALPFIFVIGCGQREAEVTGGRPSARIVSDDLDREVRMPERVGRAISLAPSLTEMIFAAGAGDRLVGVTSYCDYPASVKGIEKIGDTQSPNIERIIALKPDVVFVSTASQLESFMGTLGQQGIAVYVTDPKGIRGVIKNLRTIGALFGTAEVADQAATELGERVSRLEHGPDRLVKPRVFVQISNEPLFTIGKDSFLTEIVTRAGGELVTQNVSGAFPKLSKETASAMNPEVIFLSDSDDNRVPNAVFARSPAVKNGRVYRINADIISRPGPRLIDALEEFARILSQFPVLS
jgi:iron complex transport system substrate-binding protein